MHEKRLVDLYVNSTLDIETINHKNEVIKNKINKLKKDLVFMIYGKTQIEKLERIYKTLDKYKQKF